MKLFGRRSMLATIVVPFGLMPGCGSDAHDATAITKGGGAAGAAGFSDAVDAASTGGTGGDAMDAGGRADTPETFCASALGQTIAEASVTGSRLVGARAGNPAYCLISATLKGSLNFQVALPENWNHRILFLGGGGFDGVIPNIESSLSPGTLAAGYVMVADDSGHRGNPANPGIDGSFALDPAGLAAYANSSTHDVLPAARAIVRLRYGSDADKAYFEGCSNGGREALIEAQRWPKDFDGIIARAPASNFTGLLTAFHDIAKVVSAPGGALSVGKLTTLAKAELDACDALDGAKDGIISNVAGCAFDPTSLACAGPATDSCLTNAELATVAAIRAPTMLPYQQANALLSYPGWGIGHESDPDAWPAWIMGNPAPSIQFAFQDQFIKYFVIKDAKVDSVQTALETHAPELNALSLMLDATNTDLGPFSAAGGKLILWHGEADPAISAAGTAAYYQRVVAQTGGQDRADAFMRYYPAPGVHHCGGGPGVNVVDLVTTLDVWVTKATPPQNLVATHAAPGAGAAALSRPLCTYPTYPRYDGTGDLNAAASFTCQR
jgi:Tannase and feruloyl esterase